MIDQYIGSLSCKVPVIWLKTKKDEKKQEEDEEEDDEEEGNTLYKYSCPVFKTSKRTSIISASGRSDEHIISITVCSRQPENIWKMKGVAMITMLDD